MKIGILTFHYSINQGSVIQAYCVQNILKELYPNSSVSIINLIPLMREKYELRFFNREFPFVSLSKYRKYVSIRKFVNNYLDLSARSYHNSIEKQIKFINRQQYDIIFTGSDTVWFNSIKLNNQIPNIYFLPCELKAKKMSIAASIDPLDDEKAYLDKKEKLRLIFDDYQFITVRDSVSFELISKLTNTNLEIVADPTILYNFEKKLGICSKPSVKTFRKKKIAIGIGDKTVTNIISDNLSAQFNITNMLSNTNPGFDYIFDELNSYQQYDIIITDRFHRSIFALKLSNALVINIEISGKNKSSNSKGRDLFSRIGISEYLIRYEEGFYTKLVHDIVDIVSSWNRESLIVRNEKFQAYIHQEIEKWQRLCSSIQI